MSLTSSFKIIDESHKSSSSSSTTTMNKATTTTTTTNTPLGRPLLESEDRAANLTYGEISQYFSLPLHEAIVQLKVDESSLKKRCRQLGISRWPYRKRVNLLSKNKKSKDPNAMNDSDGEGDNGKKKKTNSLFRCFQVFKTQKKDTTVPKMSEEEHAVKQNQMQREYNLNFEPLANSIKREGRSKQMDYWKEQQGSSMMQDSPASPMPMSPTPMNYQPQQQHYFQQQQQTSHYNKPNEYYNNNGNQYHQPQPIQNQQPTYMYSKSTGTFTQQQPSFHQSPSNGYHKTEMNGSYNYPQYQQQHTEQKYHGGYPYQAPPQQQQQQLPSLSDLLAGIRVNEDSSSTKKRIRRDSADLIFQEQFAAPMKKVNSPTPFQSNWNPTTSLPSPSSLFNKPPAQQPRLNNW